ncbi:Hypothetical_protein [Hexamita inflata]|uniref:Hypothetical_protein n=1 Tax=Hexamita inflata TaxID=28002 RepID=A0AA86P192_9EUKA|nr:Hypothetical protein HINF_LOCUS17689 [Hexamita inflata]
MPIHYSGDYLKLLFQILSGSVSYSKSLKHQRYAPSFKRTNQFMRFSFSWLFGSFYYLCFKISSMFSILFRDFIRSLDINDIQILNFAGRRTIITKLVYSSQNFIQYVI